MNRTAFIAMRNKIDRFIRQAVISGFATIYNKANKVIGYIVYNRGQIAPFQCVVNGKDCTATFLSSLKA
jgi:hypothetical protein